MAKRNKKKSSPIRTLLLVAMILIVANLVFIFLKTPETPITVRQAIEQAVEKTGDSNPRTREKRRVVLAVQDYMMKNQMKPPSSLDMLVPTYFDAIPKDPETNKPFQMVLVSGRPEIVAPGETAGVPAHSQGSTGGTGQSGDGESAVSDISPEMSEALVASLLGDGSAFDTTDFVYDSTGKRDPFVPFDFSPEAQNRGEGIFCCDVKQFRLSTVVMDEKSPRAIVETQDGRGFIVREGSEIGYTRAKVIEILPAKIRILDTSTDFTGKSKTETIELEIRTTP